MSRHIIIDNSNILGGAERTKDSIEPAVPPLALRLHLRNLFSLLERGGDVATHAFGGSESQTAEAVWEFARGCDYDTYIMSRVETVNGKTEEQAVDEIMHLVMANAVLDYPAPQTLVVASGDSATSYFGTSFTTQAERALRHGWDVEVWHWDAASMSRYDDLVNRYPGKIKVQSFNNYYYNLTFLLEGEFHFGDHKLVSVKERRVRPLPPIDPAP